MSEPIRPTDQDQRNAEMRASVAARFRNQFREARALVESILGEGWIPTGRHYLADHDEEERARNAGGPATPAATVITAEKDGIRRHVAIIGDTIRECSGYEDGFGAMLTEPDPKRTFEHKGETVHIHKHSLYWAGYETEYKPRSPRQLAAAREKRIEKAAAQQQAELETLANASLFPEWIREHGTDEKRGR